MSGKQVHHAYISRSDMQDRHAYTPQWDTQGRHVYMPLSDSSARSVCIRFDGSDTRARHGYIWLTGRPVRHAYRSLWDIRDLASGYDREARIGFDIPVRLATSQTEPRAGRGLHRLQVAHAGIPAEFGLPGI